MTKRKYRVFGFKSESLLEKGCPVLGAIVLADSPEEAVRYTIRNIRSTKYIEFWGVCSLSNFVEIAIANTPRGRQIKVM